MKLEHKLTISEVTKTTEQFNMTMNKDNDSELIKSTTSFYLSFETFT